MAIYWFNFRQNLAGPTGFPGDGATSVGFFGGTYSQTGISPFTPVGMVATYGGGGIANDTTYATKEHNAGYMNLNTNNDGNTLRISGIVSGHSYKVYASQAALFATASSGFTIYSANGSGSLYDCPGGSITGGSIMDAVGNIFTTAALWEAGHQSTTIVATTSDFYIRKSSSGNNAWLNAIGLEDLNATPSFNPTITRMMIGVG